jgi:hypothetical protein
MAWTSPRTYVTDENITAAILNTHIRDNFDALNVLDSVEAASWTPDLVPASAGSYTLSFAAGKYWRIGPIVMCWGRMVVD